MSSLICGIIISALFSLNVCGQEYIYAPHEEPTDYVIIVTGGELLRGVYADGHTQFITRTLGPLGCRCAASLCVGDQRDDLLGALKYAEKHAKLIIVTGGLGPTDDDITRETISEFTGIPLYEHPDALKHMEQRFSRSGRDLRSNLRRQTLTPTKGTYLPNPNGTAVGLVYDAGEMVMAALPGPPRELHPMVQEQLIPYLSKRFGTHTVGTSLTMRFAGIGESSIDQAIHDHMTLPGDLMISSLFELGRVDLTFMLPGDTAKDRQRLEALEKELLQYVGSYMYSNDGSTLEECIIGLLSKHNLTIGIAEVGSGGAVSSNLSDVVDRDHRFRGGYIASNDEEMALLLSMPKEDLVSDDPLVETPAIKMAKQVAERIASQWGLAVTEVREPKEGAPFVWVAFGSEEDGFTTARISTRGHRETMRARLVMAILDRIRKRLEAMD